MPTAFIQLNGNLTILGCVRIACDGVEILRGCRWDRAPVRPELGRLPEWPRFRPWTEARNWKEIDEQWLAQQLRPYGVRPKTIWIEKAAAKGYLRADFEEVWPRYVARSDLEALMAEQKEVSQCQASDVAQISDKTRD